MLTHDFDFWRRLYAIRETTGETLGLVGGPTSRRRGSRKAKWTIFGISSFPISYPDPWMSYAHARRNQRLWHLVCTAHVRMAERRVVQKRAGIRVERHRKEGVSFEREAARSTAKSKDKIFVRGKTGCTRRATPKVTPFNLRLATCINGGFKIFK